MPLVAADAEYLAILVSYISAQFALNKQMARNQIG